MKKILLSALFLGAALSMSAQSKYDKYYDRPTHFPDWQQPSDWPNAEYYLVRARLGAKGPHVENYEVAVFDQNGKLRHCNRSMAKDDHLCVLRMIKMVCDNAHAHGIKAYICGELGADTDFTEVFLDLHVDGLSVTPTNILPVRKTIRSLNLSDRRQVRQNIQKHLKC